MNQIRLENKKLILKVKAYLIVKVIFSFMTLLFFIGPLIGIFHSLNSGYDFHFKFVFGLGVNYIVAFYVLRITLWNVWGKEIFEFNESEVVQTTCYKLFQNKEVFEDAELIEIGIEPYGFEDSGKGRLYFQLYEEEEKIYSSVTIPVSDLKPLVEQFNRIESIK